MSDGPHLQSQCERHLSYRIQLQPYSHFIISPATITFGDVRLKGQFAVEGAVVQWIGMLAILEGH
jgi:hypothetical protein